MGNEESVRRAPAPGRDDLAGGVVAVRDRLRTRSRAVPAWLDSRALKVLDFDLGTEVNRLNLLLGDAGLQDWWGDDWNDPPYELNAGFVYSKFVSHTLCLDISTVLVTEACELLGSRTPEWSKGDLKARLAPVLNMSLNLDHEVLVYLGDVVIVSATGPLPLIDIPFNLVPGRVLLPRGTDGKPESRRTYE